MAKPQRHKISKEDAELAQAAKKKAGGPGALAKLFGVTLPAASEWGRRRPIPRHVKPRLQEYVKPSPTRSVDEALALETASSALLRDLHRVLDPDSVSSRLARLPRRYRRRYEERVAEVLARVIRELGEYPAVLEAAHRIERSQQRARHTRAEP